MRWQDVVLMLCFLGANASLVPIIRQERYPPLSASAPTVAFVGVAAGTFGTLGLWLSAATNGIGFVLWLTIAWRTWARRRVG